VTGCSEPRSRGRCCSRIAVAALIAGAACSDDYVHVVIEGSSPDLAAAPVTVELAVFGGGQGIEHPFTARFVTGVDGSAPEQRAVDFNLVLDGEPDTVDIRVGVATPSTRWSASVVLDTPLDGATRRLELQPGDRSLGAARLAVDAPGAVTRYRTGLATAWTIPEGVALRIDGNPEQPLARPDPVALDRGAQGVRIASPPAAGTDGPERLAMTWRGGDDLGRLLLLDGGAKIGPIELGRADELHVAYPAGGIAVVLRDRAALRVSFRDAGGAETGAVAVADDAAALRAAIAAGPGVVIAAETGAGWELVRVAAGQVGARRAIAEPLALSLATSGVAILAVEDRGGELVVQAYEINDLTPAPAALPVASGLGRPAGLFGALDVAPCGVTWPEPRSDGSGDIDLWFRDLDTAGTPVGVPRILPGAWRGSHLAPRTVCVSPGVAYAVFAVAGDLTEREGILALRRIPRAAPP
jgi:hypothetical protein